jgi:hypothetical protein
MEPRALKTDTPPRPRHRLATCCAGGPLTCAVDDNDVRGFVHRWYAAFERLEPAQFFLAHFDDTEDMVFGKLHSPEEFRAWYDNWLRHCPWDHHEVVDLVVVGSAETGWQVDILLRHVGEWFDDGIPKEYEPGLPGRLFDRYLRQTWAVRHDGADFRIRRIEVWAVRDILPLEKPK